MKPFNVIPLLLILLGAIPNAVVAAQTCIDAIDATAPDSRYTNNNNGTVTDADTGLMWKQCSEGLSGVDCTTDSATQHTWQEALLLVDALNTSVDGFAGHTDWRLPNIKELASLVEEACHSPAINETLFPNTISSYYWSSSAYAYNSSHAWNVSFNYGSDNGNNRVNDRYVRLVRAGQ
ncbi:MAG: DUF1566 domain-containing protein [Aestuariibacter sp.]|nr:DUF1566 domain-containing protein [Aestuariibacter sp.]